MLLCMLDAGFKLSARIDSLKRHFESVHARDYSEDHIAHLIWGFMAIYHVNALFPQMNDLPNFEALRRAAEAPQEDDQEKKP